MDVTERGADYLEHYGVKGMKWGVRKEDSSKASMVVSERLPQNTKTAAVNVAKMMDDRYGFKIKEIASMGPENREYHMGTIGYVEPSGGKKSTGRIVLTQDDVAGRLKEAEKAGWFGKDGGTIEALVTHESAHAIFHSPKNAGGYGAPLRSAMIAAINQSRRDGIDEPEFLKSISGYAASAGNRAEAEAELFSQYHWSKSPPPFVKTWGETFHAELGIDPTPFREMR